MSSIPKPAGLLICEKCTVAGSSDTRHCEVCAGFEAARMRGKTLEYFGLPLTAFYIALRRARGFLDVFRLMGGLIFAVGAFALAVAAVYESGEFQNIATLDFWFGGDLLAAPLFWLAVMSFTYSLYRVARRHDPSPEIPQGGADKSEVSVLSDWGAALSVPKSGRFDISLRFTREAREALDHAYTLASAQSNDLSVPYVILGLLPRYSVRNAFLRMGITANQVEKALTARLIKGSAGGAILPETYSLLFYAYDIAREVHDKHVGTTEILLAAMRSSDELQDILFDMNVDKEKLLRVIEWVQMNERQKESKRELAAAASHWSRHGMDRAMTASATPFLNSYSQDITLAAKFGLLSDCVARDAELDEMFRIMQGGGGSVVLVGPPGVGKTTLVEGLAARIVRGDVPAALKEKRVVQISTSAVLAGTTVSGAHERLLNIMKDVERSKNIVLYIKNIQDLVGGGQSGPDDVGLDVSETLAEHVGPGKAFLVASATPEGFNRHILNSQIGSVLTQVEVREMDENQTMLALESKVGPVELANKVFFSYEGLKACALLAIRYLHGQHVPASAIALMSEVAAGVRSARGDWQIVEANDVGTVIAKKTGIPAAAITQDESQKLLRLEEEMHARIIGQDAAVTLAANALRRARAQFRSGKRPIAVLLFLGPTGVGKTELTKTVAEVYFGGEKQMLRFDMSEYQDVQSVYRLIGQPHVQGTGMLTEAVRQRPFSLVLLDELEKADPNVLNLFLQVFDDGRLTDSIGQVIDFSSTIIIATSNAGTEYSSRRFAEGADVETISRELVQKELGSFFKPEFLNRFDGIVLFKPLARDDVRRIGALMLKRVERELSKRGIGLRVEESGLDALVDAGYDPQFGARPMGRAISELVENRLAEMILKGELRRRDIAVFDGRTGMRVERGTFPVS